jgi:hypothetical protein
MIVAERDAGRGSVREGDKMCAFRESLGETYSSDVDSRHALPVLCARASQVEEDDEKGEA